MVFGLPNWNELQNEDLGIPKEDSNVPDDDPKVYPNYEPSMALALI